MGALLSFDFAKFSVFPLCEGAAASTAFYRYIENKRHGVAKFFMSFCEGVARGDVFTRLSTNVFRARHSVA